MKPFITFLFAVLIAQFSQAQIFVNINAAGANDGTSWANSYTNLQDALDAATAGEQIWVAAGTYRPEGPTPDSSHFIALIPVKLYGGFAGTETLLSQRDLNSNLTILSGDILNDDTQGDFIQNRSDNAHHVLIINAGEIESVIDGFTIKGGTTKLDISSYVLTAADIPYNRWSGGGLHVYKSTVIARNLIFEDNDGSRGSGFYAQGGGHATNSLTLENVIFRNNDGYNGSGGFFAAVNHLALKDCVFSNNIGFQGGGLFLSGSHATVEDCSFTGNSATYGGALNSFNGPTSLITHPTVEIRNTLFSENSSIAQGGAVFINNHYDGFTFTLDSSSFNRNSTSSPSGFGGAVAVWEWADMHSTESKSVVLINHSDFNDNISVYGGAVEIESDDDDSLQISVSHSQFLNNVSNLGYGGGLAVTAYAASILNVGIQHSDFMGNRANLGGGFILDGINNTQTLRYLVEDVKLHNNSAVVAGGAMALRAFPALGASGIVRNTEIIDNDGVGLAGGMYVNANVLLVEDSYFEGNTTEATYQDSTYAGGGAVYLDGLSEITIRNSIYNANHSEKEGDAVATRGPVELSMENVLLHHHTGNSTVYNTATIKLVNATIVDNNSGMFLEDTSSTEIQNSIFNNTNANMLTNGDPEIISKGGNLSSDATLTEDLMGLNGYADLHEMDPLLGIDYYPLAGSPVIDAGNLQGITTAYDLAGNPRVQGSAIDMGSYESFLTAIKDAKWDTETLTVFPNPVKETLNFELESDWTGEFQLRIYNYSGQQTQQADLFKTGKTQSFQYNLNNLPPGEYVLLAIAGNATYATNIIIER